MNLPAPARLARVIGIRAKLRIYWENIRIKGFRPCDCERKQHPEFDYLGGCPSSFGNAHNGIHNAETPLPDRPGVIPTGYLSSDLYGKVEDFPEAMWPTKCNDCGAPVPALDTTPAVVGQEGIHLAERQLYVDSLYDTPSGDLEPGYLWWAWWMHTKGDDGKIRCMYWDNCVDPRGHLHALVPSGETWDIDSRANNCTRKDDRIHRCWIRIGEPPNIDVGKAGGDTCSAGAGSIGTPKWHGFLTKGKWALTRL